MLSQEFTRTDVVTEDLLTGLPAPVQRYMRFSGVVGQPWIDTVQLKYKGQFRLTRDQPWLTINADQVYSTSPPSFQWKAKLGVFGIPLLRGQDTFKDGQGHMFGKLAGLFKIFDVSDDYLLQGSMMRYLQEMMWFPIAYLSDYISWQTVDDHSADVTFTQSDKRVTGRLHFDDMGRITNFIGERYRENKGQYTLDTWATPITEYGTFAGLNLPMVGCATWQLPEGDLTYIKLQVTDVDYNVPIRDF